jgi:Holliday junction DNA helicase RuvA
MIASIEGTLRGIAKGSVVVEVGGIGLRVHVPEPFLGHCGPVGSTVSLRTHLHVREDELTLYGCATEDELALFELLLTVSGIGPKVALAVLSSLSPDQIRQAIATEQGSVLSSVPGIGAKTAEKIIFHLKDKVRAPAVEPVPVQRITDVDSEVIAALTGLGYSVVEAQTALQHIDPALEAVEDRLRAALGYLGS